MVRSHQLSVFCAAICATLLMVGCARSPTDAPANLPADPAANATIASDWAQVVEAARREGKVVVAGPPGSTVRDSLVTGFQRRYPDIQLDFTGTSGTSLVPKIAREREAGLYLNDVYVGGTDTFLSRLHPLNSIDPITAALAGPNIEPSQWMGGKLDFTDDTELYNMVFTTQKRRPFAYHPASVSPGDIKSFKDLLDPKWKGKIAMLDPRLPGGSTLLFWYLTPELGQAFIRQFFTQQDVIITGDQRQLTEWVARGTYPIGIDSSSSVAEEMERAGVKVGLYDSDLLAEGGYLSTGFGSVSLFNRAPNPNAALLYINWVLSKEGQEAYSRAAGHPTRRQDVPTDFLDPESIPRPGVRYLEIYKEKYLGRSQEARDFAKTIIP
jgi:iron(III) transport system substrate-binding protein